MSEQSDSTEPVADEESGFFSHIDTGVSKKRQFLEALAINGNVTKSCEIIGWTRVMPYWWRKRDPEFAQAFDMARAISNQMLVDEAMRRAREGVERIRFDKRGDPLKDPRTGDHYVEHQYSDTLLIFLLKTLMPEQFGDRLTHQGPGGGPIAVEGKVEVEHVDDWYPKPRAQDPTAEAGGKATTDSAESRQDQIAALRASLGKDLGSSDSDS